LKSTLDWCGALARGDDGVAPLVDLAATHEKALEFVLIDILQKYAISV
jgi:uncharacterized protein (DUF2237 family)